MLDGQCRDPAVLFRNGMDDPHGFFILSNRNEELGRLVHREEEESKSPEEEHHRAEGVHRVTPARVCVAVAAVAVDAYALGIARVLGDEDPADERGDDLSHRPPNTQESEEVFVRVRNELEEDGAVEDHVACGTDTVKSEQDAKDVEVRAGAGGETEDGADEEGRVPGKPARKPCQRGSLQ